MKINIVSKQLIKPSSPTPIHLKEYKLSFIDEIIPHSYFPIILYYSRRSKSSKNIPHSDELSKGLKKSFSETLTEFYPLAGRIKGQTSIDCNDEGVLYLEARVDNNSLEDLVKSPDIPILDQLIPCKWCGIISEEKELLAVQVTLFDCGGIVIGICISHRVADGCTLSTFIKAWAAKTCCSSNTITPDFSTAKFFPPTNSPNFRPNPKTPVLQPPAEILVSKRFIFDSSAIDLLKTRVEWAWPHAPHTTATKSCSADPTSNEGERGAGPSKLVPPASCPKTSFRGVNHFIKANPSRVEVVSAVIWKSFTVALGIQDFETSVAFHPVNLRGKVFPELSEYSFGNIFQMANAVTNGIEADWISLVEKLRDGISKIDNEYGNKLLGENGFRVSKNNLGEIGRLLTRRDVHVIRFSSWCSFQLYRVDFGWGNAIWVSSAGLTSKNQVILLDSSCGGIEAWMTLAESEMPRFEQALMEEIQGYT